MPTINWLSRISVIEVSGYDHFEPEGLDQSVALAGIEKTVAVT